jgi:hypothetical protein
MNSSMLKFTAICLTVFSFLQNLNADEQLSKNDENLIRSCMQKQEDAWNSGNIGKFMDAYWKSSELVYIGSNGPTYTWQGIHDNYIKRYPDLVTMGKLKYDIIKISMIDQKTAFLIGKYNLTRSIGNASGYFSLVLKKIKGEWLIISDHTSSSN